MCLVHRAGRSVCTPADSLFSPWCSQPNDGTCHWPRMGASLTQSAQGTVTACREGCPDRCHLLKMMTWSASSKASSWSCVTRMLVTPTLSMMALRPCRTEALICKHHGLLSPWTLP